MAAADGCRHNPLFGLTMDAERAAYPDDPEGTAPTDGARVISVTDPRYGALGDLRTDDTEAIRRAVRAAGDLVVGSVLANTQRPVLLFPFSVGYLVSGTIEVPANVDVVMEAPLVVAGAERVGRVGLSIGSPTLMSRGGKFTLDVRRQRQSAWTDDSDIGIRLQNVCSAEIHVRRAQGWRTGIQLMSHGNHAGCYYNQVFFGEVRGSKYALHLFAAGDKADDGAINANNFYGGSFSNGIDETVRGESRYGVRFSGPSACNTNQFYGPSFELNEALATPGEAVPFVIENDSGLNRAHDVRSEGGSKLLARITGGDARNNYFWSAYTGAGSALATQIADSSRSRANRVFTHVDELSENAHLIFDSGDLGAVTRVYDGRSRYSVDGLDIATSDFTLDVAESLISTHDDRFVEFASAGRNLVRFLDTRIQKRFIAWVAHEEPETTWGWAVKPFDHAGELLVAPPNVHVQGETPDSLSWNNDAHAGAYVGASHVQQVYFSLDESTKSAAFVVAGAPGRRLRSLRIYSIDAPCVTWQTERSTTLNGVLIAADVPAVGSWTRGERIINHLPSPGGVEGWICVRSGTFGSLKSTTASTTRGTRRVAIAGSDEMQVGQYITIDGLDGIHRIVGTAPDSITIDHAASSAVQHAALAYAVPALRPFGSVAV